MVMQLDQVVPFGRSFDEYVKMFNLTDHNLQKSILSVADGPASFNAEGTRLGYQIKSMDPIYSLTAPQIKDRFDSVVDHIIEQVEQTLEDWVWTYHRSPQDLRQSRERTIQLFCEDYDQGKAQGRYEVGELPKLSYPDDHYDLGLSSHFLFLYSDHFHESFHLNSILEMLRVCQEIRVFPLLTLMLQPPQHLEPIMSYLTRRGYTCTLEQTIYEFQRGGSQMLRVIRS